MYIEHKGQIYIVDTDFSMRALMAIEFETLRTYCWWMEEN